MEPESVQGSGGDSPVDIVPLVRHTIHPEAPLVPIRDIVERRYREWLAEKAEDGVEFTPEQRQWLDRIKDHIASSLLIETDDFEYAPFSQMGGIGKAFQIFGNDLDDILDELNERLAA